MCPSIHLTPLVPLSLGERGRNRKEGLASLLDAPLSQSPSKEGGDLKEGGEAPLLKRLSPSPY